MKSTARGDFERLRAGYLRGPAGYAPFIKRAALESADQETERRAEKRRRSPTEPRTARWAVVMATLGLSRLCSAILNGHDTRGVPP